MKPITLIATLFTLASPFLISCSNDEPDGGNKTDNLPEAQNQFIGYWMVEGYKGQNFMFFEDGTCWTSQRDNKISRYNTGKWTYNENTSILATTVDSWQWLVTLVSDDTWAGQSLASGTIQTFGRSDKNTEFLFLLSSLWENVKDSEKHFRPQFSSATASDTGSQRFYISSLSNYEIMNNKGDSVYLPEDSYLCVFYDEYEIDDFSNVKYSIRVKEEEYRHSGNRVYYNLPYKYNLDIDPMGTITIENPYNPAKMRLKMTGPIEGEWKLNKDYY